MSEPIAPHVEDILIAERVRERRAADTGERITLDELDERLGFDPAEVAAAADELRAELGITAP